MFEPTRQVKITSVSPISKRPLLDSIPFGRKVGHITVGPKRAVGRKGKYFASCDCGNQSWYTPAELVEMLESGAGCGLDGCSALTFKEAVWQSDEALKLQLFTLLVTQPCMVQSWWGGTADDLYEESFEEGYDHLSGYLQAAEGVWLQRHDESLPFIEGNVFLGERPDTVFRKLSGVSLEVEGEMMTLKELCSISRLSIAQLLRVVYRAGGTDDLLLNLLEVGNG